LSPDAVCNINQAALDGAFSTTARVIHHDIGYMNHKLEIGRYFFTDIVTEERLLYDDATFTLAKEKVLTPAERLKIVQNDFNYWFERDAFTALEYAYIGARYDNSYTIDNTSLLYLAGQVERLLRLTETLCEARIATLQRATDQVGQ
jgi:hypothetical protein